MTLVALAAKLITPISTPDQIENRISSLTRLTQSDINLITNGYLLLSPPNSRSSSGYRALYNIVSMGASAIDALLDHLEDQRATLMVEQLTRDSLGNHLMLEYDIAQTFDERKDEILHPSATTAYSVKKADRIVLKVGDICLYAVGQIVNRDYRPLIRTGPQRLVTSALLMPKLASAIRERWSGTSRGELLSSLTVDALRPDKYWRDVQAFARLSLYFPHDVEAIAIKRFRSPVSLKSDYALWDENDTRTQMGYITAIEVLNIVENVVSLRTRRVEREIDKMIVKLQQLVESDIRDNRIGYLVKARTLVRKAVLSLEKH